MKLHEAPLRNNQEQEDENTVKGTMASVGIVGLVILVMWVLLFAIYMYRF
ncbi:MAG TPA: cytochrome c oxidase subunit 2A [Sporosarcina sp.]|nr:cytochrome c oxidase subunit 2A [Sporosarcina sp.]